MNTFFISDTHFYHNNIIRLTRRPFLFHDENGEVAYDEKGRISVDIHAMNEKLIEDWNSVVSPNDIVWHLGDFSWNDKKSPEIFSRLNGKKNLIIGNHDSLITKTLGWYSVSMYANININGKDIVLFHYPITDWDKRYHGSWHFYGHIHDNLVPKIPGAFSLEVGVDHLSKLNERLGEEIMNPNHLWAPISFEQIVKVYECQKI